MRWFYTLMLFVVVASAIQAADWPRFLGAQGDGISTETGINKDWTAQPPKELWRMMLSDNGCAAPAVANGIVYIVDHEGTEDVLRAVKLTTGQEVWRSRYPNDVKNRYGFTVSTPLIRNGKIYIVSRAGEVRCLETKDGSVVWKRDLLHEFNGSCAEWGYCMSPVADENRLICLPGGPNAAVVALNLETGATIWQGGGSGMASYATPLVATFHGQKQYVISNVPGVEGVDPASGKVLWEVPWPTAVGKKGPSPMLADGRVFITTTEGGASGVIAVTADTAQVIWKNSDMQAQFTTPLYYHGCVFGSSDSGHLFCVDPATGKVHWKQSGFSSASVLGVDDTVLALKGNSGELVLIDATADAYKELSHCKPLGGMSFTAPVFADGCLLVRNQQELVCLNLRK